MSIQPERFYPAWTLGDRIRKARMTTGLHQREFAQLIKVESGSLAAWETDRTIPRNMVVVAKSIENITGVPAAWLLGLDDGPGPDGDGGGHPFERPEAARRRRNLPTGWYSAA